MAKTPADKAVHDICEGLVQIGKTAEHVGDSALQGQILDGIAAVNRSILMLVASGSFLVRTCCGWQIDDPDTISTLLDMTRATGSGASDPLFRTILALINTRTCIKGCTDPLKAWDEETELDRTMWTFYKHCCQE